ncbi:hypothetical protein [Crocosphaera sp. XPORK-15E]|uniref:hypothetical protein n=1 Tax=Crocosphaera sp. XPORK-15E TaxID=3110247 RepID=UPI002B1EA3CC|nr:hypothetical protein [Crocosphaera sp. XPORK-15E]MEA5533147.1 hypothetical protein [Crocosphaera sp. XPORK-15E]
MAIIVKHQTTGHHYLLVGTGLGTDQALPSSRLLKNWLPATVAVCDRQGEIFWLPAAEIIVIEVDGTPPADLLPEPEIPPPPPEPEMRVNSDVEVFEDDEDEDWI